MSSTSGSRKGCDSCETADKNDLLPQDECAERVRNEFPLWSFDGNVSETVIQRQAFTGGEEEGQAAMPCLRRSFVAKDFQAALDFLNAAGKLAEEMGHHPDLHIVSYRTVVVEIYTHSVGGVTCVT